MSKKKRVRQNGPVDVAYRGPERVSVSITKATNGYIVNQYNETGEKNFVAKTEKEAQNIAKQMMKMGQGHSKMNMLPSMR